MYLGLIKNRLLALRKAKGLTMAQVAKASEISESYYCLIETEIRQPPVRTAKKIARALDFDWQFFFRDTDATEEIRINVKEVSNEIH